MSSYSDFDPYAERPSFWQEHDSWVWAVGIFVLTVVLTVLCFPPYPTPEFAYAFAAPAIFWAYLRPSFKLYAGTILTAQAVAWTIILGWLHHVTWGGLLLLGPFVGAWIGLWYLAVWWAMPLINPHRPLRRVLGVLGLAGLWVLIEWTRTWVLGGFPWLPLAASQWQRSILLQIAAFTGAYGVSFILITFNLGFAAYAHRLLREKHTGLRRRSPEFMTALLVLMFPSFLLLTEVFSQNRKELVRFSLVQPFVPQTVKWDPAKGPGIMDTLSEVTLNAALDQPEVILWPEAVTPWAVKGDNYARDFVESLSAKADIPLLLGSIAIEHLNQPDEAWFNGVFMVTPDAGLLTGYYAKRHLVPFGEYVPMRPLLGWLSKFVPIGDDFQAGVDSHPLLVPLRGGALVVGPLICYEDIYPQLARASVWSGAEVLTVHTNNGWFGEGGAAYQHAAHSVLRAVETRRPVVRVGNGGWSGWIDEFGNIRQTVTDHTGSIFFRGSQLARVSRDQRWVGRQSFYTQHGDWFVLASAAVALLAGLTLKFVRPPDLPVEPPAEDAI
ncbi:MAG: apolipoprotein N-acyltransferase [Cephaloticoccus sp.]|nr:apolipoprotein N-acyltransferase [Cephaloticoccus sp.]